MPSLPWRKRTGRAPKGSLAGKVLHKEVLSHRSPTDHGCSLLVSVNIQSDANFIEGASLFFVSRLPCVVIVCTKSP